jgi:uncharacterized protein YdaU (DUF1376 family)
MKRKIRYVSLDSSAFLLDLDFQTMTCEERGAYCSIIFNLNVNDGYLDIDKVLRGNLCNCTNFEKVFEKIKHKFLIKNGKISHKRVLSELKRARQIAQDLHIKGVKANEIRWKNHPTGTPRGLLDESSGIPQGVPKRSEEKRSEDKRREEKSEAQDASPSGSLNGFSQRLAPPTAGTIPTDFTMKLIYLNDGLCKIFPQRTPADTSSIRNLSNWVINRIKLGKFQDKIIGNILGKARNSKKGKSRKPIAVFYAQLKTELGYKQDG